MSGPSIPCGGCIISSIGKLCCCTSISTSRSSSCPSFSCARSFSRVRRRRSLASVSASGSLDPPAPLGDPEKRGAGGPPAPGFAPRCPGGGGGGGGGRGGGEKRVKH